MSTNVQEAIKTAQDVQDIHRAFQDSKAVGGVEESLAILVGVLEELNVKGLVALILVQCVAELEWFISVAEKEG